MIVNADWSAVHDSIVNKFTIEFGKYMYYYKTKGTKYVQFEKRINWWLHV